jgi:Holliday junction resolvasome RuvABC ATP-dependent DNA helicase subunit
VCLSARLRNTRLDHTLLASGLHGIGKTSLAKLIAWELGTGLVEMSGKVTVDEARAVLM